MNHCEVSIVGMSAGPDKFGDGWSVTDDWEEKRSTVDSRKWEWEEAEEDGRREW
jgi:hypothetical protein